MAAIRISRSRHLQRRRFALLAGLLLTAAVASAAPAPIRICSIDDRSGPSAELGVQSGNGLRIAVDEAIASHVFGARKIEVVTYDGKNDPQLTATFAMRCAEDDKGIAIIGGNPSSPSVAMVPIANEYAIPYFSLAAGMDNMTEPPTPYHFRIGPANRQDALAIADMLQKQGFRRVAILNNSLPFGLDAARAVAAEFGKCNISVVTQQTYDVNATDLAPQIANVRKANPDALVVFPYPADGARVMRTARQQGLQLPTVIWRSALVNAFRQLAGEAADGVVVPNTVDAKRPDVGRFFETLRVRFGEYPPILFPVLGYDAGKIALTALSQPQVLGAIDAGDIKGARKALRDAVERLGQFKGLQGNAGAQYHFSATRHHGPPDRDWFHFGQFGDHGRQILAPDYNAFRPQH